MTRAINFDTPDCRVIGGCDVYTTKAAGADKKLYKNIESSLEEQYASLLSFSAGLPPSQAKEAGASLNLSRASPFGSFSQISSRRTFAYLIATLNASHPDYDFSRTLRPSDFRRERSLKKVMNTLDTTLYNLRPRHALVSSEPPHWSTEPSTNIPTTPVGAEKWNPRMWHLIDRQMALSECSIYSYAPEEDPFSDSEDEAAIWSHNYFFFNKMLKRVCYIYLRALSMVGNQTPGGAKTPTSVATPRPKRPASGAWSLTEGEETGRKRARFWLGDKAENVISVGDADEDEDEVVYLGHAEAGAGGHHGKERELSAFANLSDTASVSPCRRRDGQSQGSETAVAEDEGARSSQDEPRPRVPELPADGDSLQ